MKYKTFYCRDSQILDIFCCIYILDYVWCRSHIYGFWINNNDWKKMGNCYDNKCIMRSNITLAMKPNLYIINSSLFILIFIRKTLVRYHITSSSWFLILCLLRKKMLHLYHFVWISINLRTECSIE